MDPDDPAGRTVPRKLRSRPRTHLRRGPAPTPPRRHHRARGPRHLHPELRVERCADTTFAGSSPPPASRATARVSRRAGAGARRCFARIHAPSGVGSHAARMTDRMRGQCSFGCWFGWRDALAPEPRVGPSLLGLPDRVVWATADEFRGSPKLSHGISRPFKMISGPPKCPGPWRPAFLFS